MTIYEGLLNAVDKAERLLKRYWTISKKRRLTKQERQKLVQQVNAATEYCEVAFVDNEDSDKQFLLSADVSITYIKLGIEFYKQPDSNFFDEILRNIRVTKCWYGIPLTFGVRFPSYGERKWSLSAYAKLHAMIPDTIKYYLCLSVYKNCGFDFPRQLIEELKPIKPNDYLDCLPDIYADQTYITVYRASQTPPEHIELIPNQLAWTHIPAVAKAFYVERKKIGQQCYIYTARIKKENIIGCYYKEGEIVQIDGVENVRLLAEEEVSAIDISELQGDHKDFAE